MGGSRVDSIKKTDSTCHLNLTCLIESYTSIVFAMTLNTATLYQYSLRWCRNLPNTMVYERPKSVNDSIKKSKQIQLYSKPQRNVHK